jgi:NADP-reducing hydrogenase subunit HndB
MAKLTIEDLKKIKEEYHDKQALREGGIAAGARNIMTTVLKELAKAKVKDAVVTTSGCAGLCSNEPMITIETAGQAPVKYISLNEDKMKKIFAEHVVAGRPVKEYALVMGHESTY